MMFINKELKNSLNSSKREISKFPFWMYHVKSNFVYEKISTFDKTKRVSRAFYKMMEISRKFPEIQTINDKPIENVLCLCEAPGGFIEALLFLNKNINIKAQSLKHCIEFSRKIDTSIYEYSDITKLETLLKITKFAKENCKYDLITADGGIDVSDDYSKQEVKSVRILYSQIIIMLYNLKVGGNFIIKIFDCFHKETVQLLNILYNHFENFEIIKPDLSRPCNSEKYVVCTNFKGYTETIKGFSSQLISGNNINPLDCMKFEKEIDTQFQDKMTTFNNKFVSFQTKNIDCILDICKSKMRSYAFSSRNFVKKDKSHYNQMKMSLSMFEFLKLN